MKQIAFTILTTLSIVGCLGPVTIAPVTVEPIHMTIDVMVHDHTTPTPAKPAGVGVAPVR